MSAGVGRLGLPGTDVALLAAEPPCHLSLEAHVCDGPQPEPASCRHTGPRSHAQA